MSDRTPVPGLSRASDPPDYYVAQGADIQPATAIWGLADEDVPGEIFSDETFKNAPLHYAIMTLGDYAMQEELVRFLIKGGANVNMKIKNGASPLHLAAQKGEIGIVRMLLDGGADPNSEDKLQRSPLHVACSEGNVYKKTIVRLLIEHGAVVNMRDENGSSPLHHASEKGDVFTVAVLLVAGANPNSRKEGMTALHSAAYQNNRQHLPPIIECLLRHGADPLAEGVFFGVRPACVVHFDEATDAELENIMKVFLKYTPDLFSKRLSGGSNFQLPWFFQFKLKVCSPMKVRYIFENTVNNFVHFGRNCWHNYSLLYPMNHGIDPIIRSVALLCEMSICCATESLVTMKDVFGWTPGFYVAFSNRILYKKIGMCFCEDPVLYQRTAAVQTSLLCAYVNAGLNPTTTDNHEASLIHHTAGSGLFPALELLLNQCSKRSVNRRDKNGSTPLHYAASVGCTKSCQILLEKGCRKGKKDHHNRTACDLAKLFGYVDVVELLRKDNELPAPDIFLYRDKASPFYQSSDTDDTSEILRRMCGQNSFDATYRSLLASPVLGLKEYQEICFKKEIQRVKIGVMSFMGKLSKRHRPQYTHFAFEPRLRGSMAEGTKNGPPDEFDIMLVMENFSEYCRVEGEVDSGVQLTCTLDTVDSILTGACYVCPKRIHSQVNAALKMALLDSDLWKDSLFIFVGLREMRVGMTLKILYNGPIYKSLPISIDLVHCIPLRMGAAEDIPMPKMLHWPVPVDFTACQCYALLTEADHSSYFKVSYTDYEDVLMQWLPSSAVEAYVIAKALRFPEVRWLGMLATKDAFSYPVFSSRSSYHLKHNLFSTAKSILRSAQQNDINSVTQQTWLDGILENENVQDEQ